MKKLFTSKMTLPILVGVFIFIGLNFTQNANAQYCKPYFAYAGNYMGIESVQVSDMTNTSGWAYNPGYTDYSGSKSISIKPGEVINFEVKFGNSYPMDLSIWIDYNRDGEFHDKDELVYASGYQQSTSGFSDKFQVPENVSFGTSRMRVMCEYSYMYQGNPPYACGTGYYYGEAEDYGVTILPNAPDASISALVAPANLFRVGEHDIIATLKSGNKAPLKDVYIDWWINSVHQGQIFWKGTLNENQTTNINFGKKTLDFPAEGPYGPFNFRFQTSKPNAFDEDANPTNDVYSVNRTPMLNDAGVLGFFGPPEGFGPGITPVRVRVRNYAPAPITSLTIYWKIDGVDQTPVTLTGLNIGRDQVQDLNIGTYNFYAKTPLGPFTVECWTSNPNGKVDEDQTNDKYFGGIGPSLAAGTYTIGGSGAHFASPAEAASYINSSGIFGEGKVTFNVNPGTYTGQIVLNSPLPRRNPIEFIGKSNFPGDVVIAATPTAQNNFVILLDGMDEISFTNMTIRNNANNTSNAGVIVSATNTMGLNFQKVNFMGVANSPRTLSYANINLLNSTDIHVTECTFNNGSVGIYNVVTNPIMPTLHVNGNDFYNFSWQGIYNQILDNIAIGGIEFTNNRFVSNSGLAPTGGISSWNSTTITNNQFTGIVGTGAANQAVIYVSHSTQNPNESAQIVSNRVSGTNLNGIVVSGAYAIVDKNYVSVSQSVNYGLAAFRSVNAVGAVGNNQFMAMNMYAVDLNNSPNLDFIYNSVISESGTLPTVMMNNTGRVYRNIFVNNGNGLTYQVGSVVSCDENILYTKGVNLINDKGVNYTSLAPWQAKGMDVNSNIALVEFESFNDLHIKYYNSALLADYPMFADESGYAKTLEMFDYDGTPRASYFLGAHELLLSIVIERQTDGFVDCVGSTDNYLTVSAAINFNAPLNYQWELDGNPIAGETEPILYFRNLRHNQAGVYKCLIGGPGATLPVYSRDVAVYVTRPTDIITQPADVKTFLGDHVVLTFQAHVNGKPIESAIANDEVKVRWYKFVDEATSIPLVDNLMLSGTKSNYLTIRDFKSSDQGEYYAIIDGLCGSVQTDRATLEEVVIDLIIAQAPADVDACEGTETSLMVTATTSTSLTITYQWMKDGTALENIGGKVQGVTTNTLTLMDINATDAGNYSVEVILEGTALKETRSAKVDVLKKPVINYQPQDMVVESGKQLTLDVLAEGSFDGDVLTYIWYKDGVIIQSSDDQYYIVDVTTPDDAGEYYVIVRNACGDVTSETVTVTITTSTTSVFEVSSKGYSLTTAMPNPVSSVSLVNFTVPVESFVKITLSDATGAGNIILTEGNYSKGTYNLNINPSAYNLASGTYFYYLESNGVRLAQKMVVIR